MKRISPILSLALLGCALILTCGLGIPAHAQALKPQAAPFGLHPPDAVPVTSATVISNALGVFDPADYGAVPKSNATTAIQAAADAASGVGGGTVQIHAPYYTTATITATNCDFTQTARNAYIQYYPPAGYTGPAINLCGSTGRAMEVDGLQLNGPGGTTLGGNLGCVDGIAVTGGPAKFRDCSIGRFRAAFSVSNIGGHVYWDNCDISASYYGVWFANNAGDYHMTDCRVASLFACLGYGASGLTIQCDKCALGFSPFTIYQVATDPNHAGGLFHCQFFDCSCEAVGNECIYSEYARLKPCATIVNTTDLIMTACGITYLDLYKLAGYPSDCDIECDAPESEFTYDGGIYGLTKGVYFARPHANANAVTIRCRGASATTIRTAPGQALPAMSIVGAM